MVINNNINDLIQYRLIKEPLKDQNIFTIFRYVDILYENITNKNICLKCFCKKRETCKNSCICNHSANLNYSPTTKLKKIKYLPKIKNKTHTSSLSYSFDEINNNDFDSYKNNNIDIISNYLLYDKIFKRNIYYTITKINKLNNSMDDSESEIDIFQKMNEGSQSLIKREIINKVFDEYNKDKLKKLNIFDNGNNQKEKKVRHISKLSSSSDIINTPNYEEEEASLNKIKNYFGDNK